MFTLVHELAHIWIAATGISNEIQPNLNRDKLHPVEIFCNEVAANALMPLEIISRFPSTVFNSAKDVFNVAKRLGISSFAFIIRALNLGLITLDRYKILKHNADVEYNAFLKKGEEKKIKQKDKDKKTARIITCCNLIKTAVYLLKLCSMPFVAGLSSQRRPALYSM